jgi:hypothetical protein
MGIKTDSNGLYNDYTRNNTWTGTNTFSATTTVAGATTTGDILYYNGSKTTGLNIGAANEVLSVNSGGTALEWKTGDLLDSNYNNTITANFTTEVRIATSTISSSEIEAGDIIEINYGVISTRQTGNATTPHLYVNVDGSDIQDNSTSCNSSYCILTGRAVGYVASSTKIFFINTFDAMEAASVTNYVPEVSEAGYVIATVSGDITIGFDIAANYTSAIYDEHFFYSISIIN